MNAAVALVPLASAHLDALLPLWRASFEDGVGIVDPHPLAEQRAYLLREVLPRHSARVAFAGETMVGWAAASRGSVAQLYVRVGWQRRGVGRTLLDWAKAQSGGSLWLYTFARNARACAFYESQGFAVAARGFEPTWQLADVRYVWRAAPAA
jgi:ribosomal protein S18 acetylase RimI-like enzyme